MNVCTYMYAYTASVRTRTGRHTPLPFRHYSWLTFATGTELPQVQTQRQVTQPSVPVAHPSLPLFSPDPMPNGGLELLTVATSAASDKEPVATAAQALLSKPGPFNPATSLSAKVVKCIFRGNVRSQLTMSAPKYLAAPHHQHASQSLTFLSGLSYSP